MDLTLTEKSEKSLTTPLLDFWLLGGASILLWFLMMVLQYFRQSSWAINHHYLNTAALSSTLALVVNHPHFMISYKLAYRKGVRFALRFWFQLIAVPVCLVAFFVSSYVLTELENVWGIRMLQMAVLFMFFTVGWHYTKQTYGCFLVYSKFGDYPVSSLQRKILKYSLYTIWALSFINAHASIGFLDYFEFPYPRVGLPPFTVYVAWTAFGAGLALISYFVFFKTYKEFKKLPNLQSVAPIVALTVWWIPAFYQPEFYANAVPFFHSLQYLAFVYKIESKRSDALKIKSFTTSLSIFALLLIGFFFFELLPNSIDSALATKETLKVWFFFIAFNVFINVHHYFIDNVIWRFEDEDVKKYLFS